ncbi:MAG: UDP-N-acetylglucosamine 1-carboxyvinyltransferase [Clostridia bacterium]|nr:UDP-N-acetylglucosamine 1-carboxyvinyltransferase [Clostridia bacterium]
MDQFVINGGRRLTGCVSVSGAKNAGLPVMAAAALCDDVCIIDNLPYVKDIIIMADLLRYMGAEVSLSPNGRAVINPRGLKNVIPPEDMVAKMRASTYLMGILLGRFNEACVPPPGGCSIGARPIDQHLRGFEALGARVEEGAFLTLRASKLVGSNVYLEASVGATINIILAAVKAEGVTVIHGCAKEPHVVDVANFLNNMGASIRGAGTDTIRIRGVQTLRSTSYTIIPDQIETGTWMIMAAATKGDIVIENCIPPHMEVVSAKLRKTGAEVIEGDDFLRVRASGRLNATNIRTMVYPGFPTDLQQPMSAMLTCANGRSIITETIYEQRYRHLEEMRRMGAKVQVEDRVAFVDGVERLYGRTVEASDLRAGAALIVAGLMAEGTTTISGVKYIDRGYERIEDKLTSVGADIKRI